MPDRAQQARRAADEEANDPNNTMRAQTETFLEQQKATVERAQELYACKCARKVLVDAARGVRIAGASVALTERYLEDMREGAGSFGAEGGLTKRC